MTSTQQPVRPLAEPVTAPTPAPHRATALTGPAAAVLLLAGLFESNIETSAPADRISKWLADHGNTLWMAHATASVLGATLLAVFTQYLVARLDRGAGTLAGRLVGSLGTVVATALYVGAAQFAAVPVGRFFEGAPDPDPSTYRYLMAAAAGVMVIFVSLPASALAASTSLTGLRSGALPHWLGWAGLVLAVLMLLSAFVAPLMVFGLWLALSGITLAATR